MRTKEHDEPDCSHQLVKKGGSDQFYLAGYTVVATPGTEIMGRNADELHTREAVTQLVDISLHLPPLLAVELNRVVKAQLERM